MILEGEVEVTKVINNNQTRMLKTLGSGDFFGEMALIHNAPRAATVKAITPLVSLEIDKKAFTQTLKNSSSVSLAMVREISRRLRENDELAIDDLRMRTSELAEAYQKLAEQEMARRDFLTNISHQLRTPLTAASGYLQMLQKGAIPPEKTSEAMELVTRNVQQIAGLVNDILFVQEMDLILQQFEPVNLVELARQVASRLAGKIEARKITLRVRSDIFIPPVMGDCQNLERALTALVDNAIKFSPEGGKVEIRLRRKGDQIGVEVIDQGIGIQPEILPHIFERFYHVDRSEGQLYEGLGLGLAITKQVIEQHKGHLDVISTPGKGSTFIMWLNFHAKNGAPGEESGTII